MKKAEVIKWSIFGIVLGVLFLAVFGKVLIAWFFFPFHSDICIVIPEGEYVYWDELRERPERIDEYGAWFHNELVSWQIGQLERYMKKNAVCIAPGEYLFDSSYHGDELIGVFDYVDVESLQNE